MPKRQEIKATHKYPGLWKGMTLACLIHESSFVNMAYDLYCPSVKNKIAKRVCKDSGVISQLWVQSLETEEGQDGLIRCQKEMIISKKTTVISPFFVMIPWKITFLNCLNRQHSSMLTRIGIAVMIVRCEPDMFF